MSVTIARSKARLYFLLTLLVGVLIIVYFIFRPFLTALVLAMSFAVMVQPIHQRMLMYTRRRLKLAAFLTTMLVIILVIAPLVFLGIEIYQEAHQLYSSLLEGPGKANLLRSVENFVHDLQTIFPVSYKLSFDLDSYLKQGLGWVIQSAGSLFSDAAKMAVSFFVFLIALYYLLKDGMKLKEVLVAFSPLTAAQDEMIMKKLELAVGSVMKGNLEIALIQGSLTALGFMIFGVPNTFLWGSVAAIAALLPGIGTALVLTPAIIFLFLSGQTFAAFGLSAWGMIAVGLIDNILGPILIGRGAKLHPLLVFLSVLGGLAYFGPFGFLLGPLAVNLLLALLAIYSALISVSDKANGKN